MYDAIYSWAEPAEEAIEDPMLGYGEEGVGEWREFRNYLGDAGIRSKGFGSEDMFKAGVNCDSYDAESGLPECRLDDWQADYENLAW